MKKLILTAAAIGLAIPATPAFADDHTPELSKVDWYRVNMIKWKPGKGERAHEIIEMFAKVDAALGYNDVIDFHMQTGDYDSIVALPMRGGIAQLGWAENPEGKKWEAEFVRQVGGEAKAKALWEEFDSLILRQDRQIGHIDRD
ncbi:hypothetical protein [Qipengyuania nanhaisediminis]|uniref:Uncharacterized protein n=1 Tax=Qipengyuania nanhaisediminis TaxID=604088 RepID=A0A1I5MCZ4_9SPHN|nr:hypothetical protein [Qipengyuania nanhaisediminis]SFP07379.1 hypothetical protein SAMN04488060_1279 [Qipengyuania nanhaisediminis]